MSTPTDRQLAGNQRRTLGSIRKRLLKMAAEWDGVDQFNMAELEAIADRVESLSVDMTPDDIAAKSAKQAGVQA